jgi:uncharacterized protein (TIGR02996 family)
VPSEAELLALLRAEPSDEARLVYADWLLDRGDPRGQVIVLDHKDRTTPGGLRDPDLLTLLLRLTAEHGFPHLPDPDEHLLPWHPFRDAGTIARQYTAAWEGRVYRIHYRDDGALELHVDNVPSQPVRMVSRLRLTDEETNVILSVASRAIRRYPHFPILDPPTTTAALRAHPDHRAGPYPRYTSHEIAEDFDRPEWSLAARDYKRWYVLWDRLMGPSAWDLR